MSISTTYQIISKNETYSLSWPTHLVFDETLANEEPIVGILTLTSEINLFDEEGNITGVATVTNEDPVRNVIQMFLNPNQLKFSFIQVI